MTPRTPTRNRYYDGPPSDHYDGTRFFVPGHPPPDKTWRDLWRFRQTPSAPWPERVANPPAPPPPARVEGDALRVTSLGHASHLLQLRGLNLLVDPVFSERASPFRFAGPRRVAPPGLALEALPAIDAILITHNHYDHLDLDTLARLQARGRCRIVVPLGNDAILRRRDSTWPVEAYDWNARVPLSPEVAATLLPSHHWSARWTSDRRMALWCAFLVETPDGAIYHIGDTGYRDGAIFRDVRVRFGPPRLAIVPISAYEPRWFMRDQHVDPAEAVRIVEDCGARHALAHHWGTFRLTTEGWDEPPRRLAAAMAEAGMPPERFRVQRPGECFDVPAT